MNISKKKETKDRIIEAAYEEFSEKGFDGARMHKIAERAKINKAMLHYYYKDKETLYEQVLEYFHNLFDNLLQNNNINSNERISFITQTVDTYFQMFYEYPQLKNIFMHEFLNGMKTLKKIYTRNGESDIQNIIKRFFLLNKIVELQKSHHLRSDIPPEHLMLSIIGLIESALIQVSIAKIILNFNDKKVNNFINERKKTIIKILDKGLAP